MLSAFGRRSRLLLGGFAALLTFGSAPVLFATDGSRQVDASGVEQVATRSNDGIDQVTTGSIGSLEQVTPAKGSAAFRAALKLVADGDHAAAYEAARTIPSDLERRTVQWAAIYFGGGKVDYASVLRFMADAPGFADASVFKTRLEQALVKADPDDATIIKVLGGAMPNTIEAQIALAEAYVADGQTKRAERIARTIWVENFLDRRSEDRILAKLGDLLDRQAHWDRAVHLMMHDRASGVERLMKFMTPAQKSLAVARNATSRNAKDAKKLLDNVDPAFKTHPVYYFSRAQRARQFELWDDAIAWLVKAKGDAPDAAEFWYERRTLVRQLLAANDAKRAYIAAARYTDGPEGRLVEAHFHAGWIALAFLKEPAAAIPQFEAMTTHSTLPDSVTQAQYWLGRARMAAGDAEGAAKAYGAAAKHATVYYGILARTELGLPDVELRGMPEWRSSEAAFNASDLVQAVRLLAENGHQDMASPLLRSFAVSYEAAGDMVLAARLAQEIGAHDLAIFIADTADKRGTPLDLFNFPKDGLPSGKLASVDKAAVYAITRQESRFKVDAISSVGARGLMQLMPATAKETARKVGVEYSSKRLTSDPDYNTLLGSTYLAAQLARFDGSLVLAAAAYNAGGGNANKWVKAFGDPRSDTVDPVIWIELIPFQETRMYVKRVLANYVVYQARLGHDEIGIKQALRRIPG
ncbi:MAG TPA: lytic transglycosylase domain-containing protein [Devosia sp.]